MRAVEPIPDTMQAVVLHAYDGAPDSLRVETRPVPRPQRGQVLVKMTAAPINPSDLMFLKGLYGVRKPLPVVPGWEGAGRVVATGDDWLSRLLLGKRVACGAPNQHDGTWAEYMLTASARCVPLIDSIDDEAGAMLIVNPLTAWALMDTARRGGHRAFVQTAAASALGRMLLRLSLHFGVEGVHIVRREEQAELLRSLGARHVLNSEAEGFDEQLRETCRQLNATIAFEAASGMTAARVLRALPETVPTIGSVTVPTAPPASPPKDPPIAPPINPPAAPQAPTYPLWITSFQSTFIPLGSTAFTGSITQYPSAFSVSGAYMSPNHGSCCKNLPTVGSYQRTPTYCTPPVSASFR